MTRAEILEAIKEMNVLELSELVKDLEETFGVSAAAPAAVMAAPAAGAPVEAAEEKTEFDVVLDDFGAEKIKVIKVVREATGLGLTESKALVESKGKIKEAVSKEIAEDLKKKLEEVGAKVSLK